MQDSRITEHERIIFKNEDALWNTLRIIGNPLKERTSHL